MAEAAKSEHLTDAVRVSINGKESLVKAAARPALEGVIRRNLILEPKDPLDPNPLLLKNHPQCGAVKDGRQCNRPAGHMDLHNYEGKKAPKKESSSSDPIAKGKAMLGIDPPSGTPTKLEPDLA